MNTISWNNVNFQKEKSLDASSRLLMDSVAKVSRPIHEFERAEAEEGTKEILFQRQKETDKAIEAHFNGQDYIPEGPIDHAQLIAGIKDNDTYKQQAKIRGQSITKGEYQIDALAKDKEITDATQSNRLAEAVSGSKLKLLTTNNNLKIEEKTGDIRVDTASKQATLDNVSSTLNLNDELKNGKDVRDAKAENAKLTPKVTRQNMRLTDSQIFKNYLVMEQTRQSMSWKKEQNARQRGNWKKEDKARNADRAITNDMARNRMGGGGLPTESEAKQADQTLHGAEYAIQDASLLNMSKRNVKISDNIDTITKIRDEAKKTYEAQGVKPSGYSTVLDAYDKRLAELAQELKVSTKEISDYSTTVGANRSKNLDTARNTLKPKRVLATNEVYNVLKEKVIESKNNGKPTEYDVYDLYNSKNLHTDTTLTLSQKQATLEKTRRIPKDKASKAKATEAEKLAKTAKADKDNYLAIATNFPNASTDAVNNVTNFLKNQGYLTKKLTNAKHMKNAMIRFYGTDNISAANRMSPEEIQEHLDDKNKE